MAAFFQRIMTFMYYTNSNCLQVGAGLVLERFRRNDDDLWSRKLRIYQWTIFENKSYNTITVTRSTLVICARVKNNGTVGHHGMEFSFSKKEHAHIVSLKTIWELVHFICPPFCLAHEIKTALG